MNAFSSWQGERVGVRMPGKKDSGKYPKSKLILYHNDQFGKVGEQIFRYGANAASSWQSML